MKRDMKPKYGFFKNSKYAMEGVKTAFKNEKSFRIECFVCGFFGVVSVFLPISLMWHFLLLSVLVFILCVECMNSAIESVVDLVSPEYHILAKAAKDLGSAAVFFSICVAVLCWGFALFEIFIALV